MPKVVSAISPKSESAEFSEKECPLSVRAELVSLGGAVLLGIGLLITAIFIMAMFTPDATQVQRFIALAFFITAWGYFFNSITEKIMLCGDTLIFKAFLSRTREIQIAELEMMILTHQGFNLEHGIENLEFRCVGKKPDKVSLGPCWQRNKLESFVSSVQKIMDRKGGQSRQKVQEIR